MGANNFSLVGLFGLGLLNVDVGNAQVLTQTTTQTTTQATAFSCYEIVIVNVDGPNRTRIVCPDPEPTPSPTPSN